MSVKQIIQESLDANPIGLKEAFIAAIQTKIAEALQNKIAEFNITEAKAESPVAGTKKIASFDGKGDHRAEVRKSEDGEFQVHHYNAGKHMGEGPVSYHGEGKEGKEDAMDTAKHAVNNMHIADDKLKMNEEVEQIDEISVNKMHDYSAAAKQNRAGNDAVIAGKYPGSDAKAYADNDKRKKGLDLARKKIHNKLMKNEEVELDEGNADNKLKKNVFTAKLGHAADVTHSNYASKELKPFTSRSGSGDSRPALKNAVGKMLRAGRAELKHGKNAGFTQTLNDFGKNVREEVELEEGQYDDMIADFKAKGGKVTKGETKPRDPNVSSIHKHRIYGTSMKAASIGARTTSPVNPAKKIKEEVEQIDEISKGLATAYTAKAKRTLRPLQNKLDMGLPNAKAMKMTNKRSSGIVKAIDKLSGSAKINATEETEQE